MSAQEMLNTSGGWRPPQPLPMKIANTILGPVAKAVDLSPEGLMTTARRSTGLEHFGWLDVERPLGRLCEALEAEGRLTLVGRSMMRAVLTRCLENRLVMADWIGRHPEVLTERIERPIFVIGLPRTGSTLLQRLLAADPRARSLRTWETFWPSPPPEEATYGQDPRIRQTQLRMDVMNWLAPGFKAIHEWRADAPEEGIGLLQNTFMNITFPMMAPIPSYGEYLETSDQHAAYRLYREQLQFLQSRFKKGWWMLKSPVHLFALDAVLESFPDAIIVQTHRDPAQVLPSICSYFTVFQNMLTESVDPVGIGRYWLDQWAQANERALALREDPEIDARFVDVKFDELMADPMAAIARIYQASERELDADALAAMQAHRRDNPRNKHGVHKYSLGEFGLDAEEVHRRFGLYEQRFEVGAGAKAG